LRVFWVFPPCIDADFLADVDFLTDADFGTDFLIDADLTLDADLILDADFLKDADADFLTDVDFLTDADLTDPPSKMSVPRPAMLVATVTAPNRPACATISFSGRALST
jgi:hypothetical protein